MSQIQKKFLQNGAIARLINDVAITARNSANNADVDVIKLNGSDKIEVGADLLPSPFATKLGNDLSPWLSFYVQDIYGGNGNKALELNGGSRLFYDQGGSNVSIDVDGRTLKDTTGFTAIDYSLVAKIVVSKEIDMQGSKISQLLDPTALDHAATKNYVDTEIGNLSSTYVPQSEKGAALGVATLDASGKIPAAQLPSTVMEYQGTWDASTNTPTLADGVGDNGDVYLVSAAGTQNLGSGNITFAVGDWAIYNGATWQKSGASSVASLNNKESIILGAGDITNQYVDLAQTILANSLDLVVSGLIHEEGVDYTVSLTGGSGGVTRITFAGDLATGGASELVAGDKLLLKYQY